MLIGICGGYQMLGTMLSDPQGMESEVKECSGLGLLDAQTVFLSEKHLYQVEATHLEWGLPVRGYEIHMGETILGPKTKPVLRISSRNSQENLSINDGAISPEGNVWGVYVHGLFDDDLFRRRFIDSIRLRKGLHPLGEVTNPYNVDAEYDKLAALLRENLDVKLIYRLIGVSR
jgi:adenosylcobyric acid synthase